MLRLVLVLRLVLRLEKITINFSVGLSVAFAKLHPNAVYRCSSLNCMNDFLLGAVRRTAPITVLFVIISLMYFSYGYSLFFTLLFIINYHYLL